MAKKDVLNQRTNQFTIVLNDSGWDCFKNADYIVRRIRTCDLLCVIYIACIKHDKDIDEETQHVKTTHYHLVMLIDRTLRLGSMLNLLVDIFKCNANQISIDKCTSLCMQSRYLIHLDELPNEKHHYNEFDVITYDSHNSRKQFCDYLNAIIKISDVNDIIAIIRQFPRLDELIKHIGFDNYKKYRLIILDLKREQFDKY